MHRPATSTAVGSVLDLSYFVLSMGLGVIGAGTAAVLFAITQAKAVPHSKKGHGRAFIAKDFPAKRADALVMKTTSNGAAGTWNMVLKQKTSY